MDGSKRMPRGGMSPVALLAIVMAVVACMPSLHECSPTEIKPNLTDIEVNNIGFKYDHVVANMAGYVELLGETTIYLPFDARSIHNARYFDEHSERSLVMSDESVHVRMEYNEKDGRHSYDFTSIKMAVNDGTLPAGSYKGICSFDEQFVFSLPVDSRYSCQKVISHQCSKDGKPVANLVLKSFEMEIDGESEKIANREFSKAAWEESCDHWSGSEQSS